MWCPQCGGEYIEGVHRCPRCEVPLRSGAPSPPRPERRLLGPATTAAIVGLTALFAARLVPTVVVVSGRVALTAVGGVHVAAWLAMGVFLAAFLGEREPAPGAAVRWAAGVLLAVLAAAGSAVVANLGALWGAPVLPHVLTARVAPWLSLLVPAAAALFFGLLRRDRASEGVRRETSVALAASLLSLLMHVATAFRWLLWRPATPPAAPSPAMVALGLVAMLLVWAGLTWFLVALRRDLAPAMTGGDRGRCV